MIFGYSSAEAKKAVASMIALAGAIAALIISDYDPNVTETCIALAGSVFEVIGVFLSKNFTEEDLSKAVSQLQSASLTVVGYFAVVDPGTVETITMVAGALVSAYAVYRVTNEGEHSSVAETNPAPGG